MPLFAGQADLLQPLARRFVQAGGRHDDQRTAAADLIGDLFTGQRVDAAAGERRRHHRPGWGPRRDVEAALPILSWPKLPPNYPSRPKQPRSAVPPARTGNLSKPCVIKSIGCFMTFRPDSCRSGSRSMLDIEPFWRDFGFEVTPAIDIVEKEKAFEVTAELPGLDVKNIELQLSDNVLTIKGEKPKRRKRRPRTATFPNAGMAPSAVRCRCPAA